MSAIRPEPWLLGHGELLARAKAQCEAAGMHPRCFEVLDAASREFFALLNACNQVAFGGLGMPSWVQLDCCTLPGLMVGFGGAPGAISAELQDSVRGHLSGKEPGEFWPYSEFCGITRGADELVGVSTFSLVPRQRLGLRAKALGLWLSGAKRQIGMTQWDNAATALHCKFGPLQVLSARTENHSRPETTFVYRLAMPSPEALLALAMGQSPEPEHTKPTHALPLDESLSGKVQAMMESGQTVQILGWSRTQVELLVTP